LIGKPDDLKDPFGNKPLHYKLSPGGFTVYSVGIDRVDDGGRVQNPNNKATFDIVASYPAPIHAKRKPIKNSDVVTN